MTKMLLPLILVAAAPAAELDPDTAVRQALENNPGLVALGHELARARAGARAAGVSPAPTLRLGPLSSDRLLMRQFDDGEYREPVDGLGFALRWRPENPGVASGEAAAAEGRVEVVSARIELARRAVAARVRDRHGAVLNLAERLKLAERTATLRAEGSARLTERLANRRTTLIDRDVAIIGHLAALADVEELAQRHADARADLARALGRSGGEPLALSGALQACAAPEGTPDAWVERATTTHPALTVYDAEMRAVDGEIDARGWARVPWLGYAQLGYRLGEGTDPTHLSNPPVCTSRCDDPARFEVRVSLTLPFLQAGHAARLDALHAERAGIRASQTAAAATIATRVQTALAELHRLAALHQRYGGAETLLTRTEADIRARVETGVADANDAAKASERIVVAQAARLRIELRCHRAAVRLAREVGDVF